MKALNHIRRYQEPYLHLPGAVGLLFGLGFLFHILTGRSDQEDIGGLVGIGVQAFTLILAALFTRIVKPRLFFRLSKQERRSLPPRLILLDSCETLALFGAALWCLSH